MMPTWQALSIIGTILVSGASGGVYLYEIKQQVAENTTARLLQTWERLSAAKKERRLSQEEWIKWCDAGLRLKIIKTCQPR